MGGAETSKVENADLRKSLETLGLALAGRSQKPSR